MLWRSELAQNVLHYSKAGSGPLLVFLHPVGLDGSFWGDLPRTCAEACTVVSVDLRGHGQSPDAARPGRMADYVADVVALLEDLQSGPAILLGLSFGGMIAQNLAIARPDLVAGLIVCACPGRMPEAARDAILARGSEAEKNGMETVLEPTLQRWFTPSFMSSPEVARVSERLLADKPSNFAAAWEAISGHDALDRLAALRIPALVVGGESDAATSVEASTALAAAFGNAELAILPKAPHMMQIECPDLFAATVMRFLNKHAKRVG